MQVLCIVAWFLGTSTKLHVQPNRVPDRAKEQQILLPDE